MKHILDIRVKGKKEIREWCSSLTSHQKVDYNLSIEHSYNSEYESEIFGGAHFFSCLGQLNRWHCRSLTQSVSQVLISITTITTITAITAITAITTITTITTIEKYPETSGRSDWSKSVRHSLACLLPKGSWGKSREKLGEKLVVGENLGKNLWLGNLAYSHSFSNLRDDNSVEPRGTVWGKKKTIPSPNTICIETEVVFTKDVIN